MLAYLLLRRRHMFRSVLLSRHRPDVETSQRAFTATAAAAIALGTAVKAWHNAVFTAAGRRFSKTALCQAFTAVPRAIAAAVTFLLICNHRDRRALRTQLSPFLTQRDLPPHTRDLFIPWPLTTAALMPGVIATSISPNSLLTAPLPAVVEPLRKKF
jgi:hypothetical protein